MNLRSRFALITAVMVLLLSVALSLGAYGIASRQLQKEIDQSLRIRAGRMISLIARPDFRPNDVMNRGVRDEILSTELDAITQINLPDESVVGRRDNPELPVSDADRQLAARGVGYRFSSYAIENITYRVLTVAVADGSLIKVAKDSAIIDRTRNGMRVWFPVLATLAVVVAGLIGWLFARRVSRPIEELADTAEHVADTQDLEQQIEVNGNDEVAQLARSFNTMLEALRVSVGRQRQLVQDASHELRTPLTSLRANTELLARNDLPLEDRESILVDMRAEVDELVELSAELSALATDQRAAEEPTEVDLADVAADVAARASRRSSTPVTVHSADGTLVTARPHQLERAISNLVDNAVKFSDSASPIEIHVGGYRVEVRDHGPGISDADKPHVFDRFYRATSTRSKPGSGLGLAIVSQFAEDHGVSAYVLDNAGGGAIVGLQFPPPLT